MPDLPLGFGDGGVHVRSFARKMRLFTPAITHACKAARSHPPDLFEVCQPGGRSRLGGETFLQRKPGPHGRPHSPRGRKPTPTPPRQTSKKKRQVEVEERPPGGTGAAGGPGAATPAAPPPAARGGEAGMVTRSHCPPPGYKTPEGHQDWAGLVGQRRAGWGGGGWMAEFRWLNGKPLPREWPKLRYTGILGRVQKKPAKYALQAPTFKIPVPIISCVRKF